MSNIMPGWGLRQSQAFLRRMGAEEHGVDAAALGRQHLHQAQVHRVDRGHVHQAAADAGWLVASTTCQPAWLSWATASSAAGSGLHSSGSLTWSSRKG
jgi:hypothetical protein